MMIYQRDKKNKKNIYQIVFLVVFLLVLISPVRNFFRSISISIFSRAGATKVWAQEIIESTELSLLPKSKLIEKIKAQEEEINRLAGIENLYNELLLDYKKTSELLGMENNFPNLSVATVLSNPSQNIYGSILIKGSFAPNSLVLSETNIPIGTIDTVTKNNSTVLLFSHSGRETEAFLDSDATPIKIVGKGSGNFTISLPREIKVAEGQRVYLPGVKTAVARVGYVEFDARDPFQTVYLLSEQNIYKIDYVLVESKLE